MQFASCRVILHIQCSGCMNLTPVHFPLCCSLLSSKTENCRGQAESVSNLLHESL